MVFPLGSPEPWEFCEAPLWLRRGREKGTRGKGRGRRGRKRGMSRAVLPSIRATEFAQWIWFKVTLD